MARTIAARHDHRPSPAPLPPGHTGGFLRNPALRFVGAFALLILAFYLLTLTAPYKAAMRKWLRFNAVAASLVLNGLGQKTTVTGTQVSSAAFGIDVHRGCDATEPLALFAAALLAFPARGCRKPLGLAVGAGVLLTLNQVRMVSLFFVGKHWPKLFELMHIEVWQVLFIGFALALWAWWILRSLSREAERKRAGQPSAG